jgi:hypothetical protein
MSIKSVTVVVVSLAALGIAARVNAQQPNGSAKTELVVGRDDLQQLRWIVGSWRGEADGQTAFYERYRFVDDSTLVADTYSDSKFRSMKGSIRYELRDRRIKTRGGNGQWIAVGLDSLSAAFRPLAGATNDFLWQRHDADEWMAVWAWPPTPDRPARTVTYHMRKVKGS